jgi:hypothetical protein
MGMMSDFIAKKDEDKDKNKDKEVNSDSYLIKLMNDLNLEKQCKTGQVNLPYIMNTRMCIHFILLFFN